MKKHKLSKYRLMSIGVMALMFLLFMKNTSLAQKSISEVLLPFGIFIASVFLFFYGPALEKKEEEKNRKDLIKKEYPEFALKTSMLIQAGFTPRGALERIGRSYSRKKEKNRNETNLFYEEILSAVREMESGIPEITAYENLGKRCNLVEMIRLCGLLIRDVKRGSNGLAQDLKEESKRAVSAKKEIVRKKGEVAGTKLLFPMMLFLLIVMVIILYPGFTAIASL